MKLAVKITELADGQFRASCPALPGCVAAGGSVDETRRQMALAVEGYIRSLNAATNWEISERVEPELVSAAPSRESW